MDQPADVGSFFSHYLAERFRSRFGETSQCVIDDWRQGDEARPRLATGGSGLNVLVEFRPDEAAWSTEFAKLSRQHWCQRLSDVPSMERLADTCHFVGWDVGDLARIGALLAFYSQACTPGLMLHPRDARTHSRPHALFVNSMLDRQIGASDSGFGDYLKFIAPLIGQATWESAPHDQQMLWVHLWDGSLRGAWLDGFADLFDLGEWMAKQGHSPLNFPSQHRS